MRILPVVAAVFFMTGPRPRPNTYFQVLNWSPAGVQR